MSDDDKRMVAQAWITMYETIAELLGQPGGSFGVGFLQAYEEHMRTLGFHADLMDEMKALGIETYKNEVGPAIEELIVQQREGAMIKGPEDPQ